MPESIQAQNRVELLHDGDACFSALLGAIEAAQREILLEMYWFGSDATGRRFASALAQKARDGVRVCITYDAAGSFGVDGAMFDGLRRAGAGVYEYRPVRMLLGRINLAAFNRRNHRKILVLDGRLGFTGGVNLADPWASVAAGGLGFRDDMIAIEGPAVTDMRDIFLATYRGRHRDDALREKMDGAGASGTAPVRVLATDARQKRRLIERSYLQQIRSARERILITNSYFIPSLTVRHALAQAAKRGVIVRVLLPVESDVPAVTYATRAQYGYMLRKGIELYEWSQSILHSKTAVIDGRWCTVGTYNLDYRSLAFNLEINVVVEDTHVAAKLEARMQRDMDASVRVDAHGWRFRPLGQRVLELFFYLFRKLL